MGDLESELFKLNILKNLDHTDFSQVPQQERDLHSDNDDHEDDDNSSQNSSNELFQPAPYPQIKKTQNEQEDQISSSNARIMTNTSQRSQSAGFKNNNRQSVKISSIYQNKPAAKENIYSTPKKSNLHYNQQNGNLSQNYMNESQMKENTLNQSSNNFIFKTAQSKYVHSISKDDQFNQNQNVHYQQNSYKKQKSNDSQITTRNPLFSNNKSHFSPRVNSNYPINDEDDEDQEQEGLDENGDNIMQKKRNFEQNLESKRQLLEKEFAQVEDRRRAEMQQLKDSQTKCQFRDILNGWINENKKKQLILESMQTKSTNRSQSAVPTKMLFQKLQNSNSLERSICQTQSGNGGGKDENKKKEIFNQTKSHQQFGYIIPQAQYLSSTQKFFPLKSEKDTTAIQTKLTNIQQEIDRVEALIFNQTQIHTNMNQDVTNLVFIIVSNLIPFLYSFNFRQKILLKIIQEKNIMQQQKILIKGQKKKENEYEEKHEQFQKVKVKIDTNMKKTQRDLKQLDHNFQGVDEKQKQILNEQVKRAIENQISAKHSKDNMSYVLIQIDKMHKRLEETTREIQELEEISEQYIEKEKDQLQIIEKIRLFEDLNSLFLKGEVKNYMNNSKLQEIHRYVNRESSIAFDEFELDSPLIKYKQTLKSQNSFSPSNRSTRVDSFLNRHPEGAQNLSDRLISYFQTLCNSFESQKVKYNELNFIKSEKNMEDQELQKELEIIRNYQSDSPLRIATQQHIQQQVNSEQTHNIVQNLFTEKELNPAISIFQATSILSRDNLQFENTLLYSFMALAYSFIRKSNTLLLMQNQCNVNLGEDFKERINSSLEKINRIIRNDTKVMKKQNSVKQFEIPQELMKDMGSLKRNLGLKLLSQVRLNESSNKNEVENNNILIVFNEFSDILLNNHLSNIQPDSTILEKWVTYIKNDNLIYGFANHDMISNYLRNLEINESDKYDPTFSYVFDNMHLLKNQAYNQYQKSFNSILHLEHSLILDIQTKIQNQIEILNQQNPKFFQSQKSKTFKQNRSKTVTTTITQKFPFVEDFQNQNQLIKQSKQDAIQRIEQQVDNPTELVIERTKNEKENSKTGKTEFNIEFFLEKLKTDGKKNLKKELIENDEIARKEEEKERRKSSLLYKTDQEEYFNYKEQQHFNNNLESIKKNDEILQSQTQYPIQQQKYPNRFYNQFNEDTKSFKNVDNVFNQRQQQPLMLRKRIISCDLNKKKPQNTQQQEILKPSQIGSARKNLALNSNLINHISRLDAMTQSIDKDKLERQLNQSLLQVNDLSQLINQSSVGKQRNQSNNLTQTRSSTKQRITDNNIYEEYGNDQEDSLPYKRLSIHDILTKARTETNDDNNPQQLNQLQRINQQLFGKTLKEPKEQGRNSSKSLSQHTNYNNKQINEKNNTNSNNNNNIKKHKSPYRNSFHSILSSILDEQIRIKEQYPKRKQSNNLIKINLQNEDNQYQQQQNPENNIIQNNELVQPPPQNEPYRKSLIKPQKVESQEKELTKKDFTQSSTSLNKFLNLKVYTNQNKSLKYIKKNSNNTQV